MRLNYYKRRRTGRGSSRIATETIALERADPLARQIEHFGAVDTRRSDGACQRAATGLQNLRVTDAIVEAAKTGKAVNVPL
jgi:predicted dehydrogenase